MKHGKNTRKKCRAKRRTEKQERNEHHDIDVVSRGTYFGREILAFCCNNIEIGTAARVARVVGSIKERSSVTLRGTKN